MLNDDGMTLKIDSVGPIDEREGPNIIPMRKSAFTPIQTATAQPRQSEEEDEEDLEMQVVSGQEIVIPQQLAEEEDLVKKKSFFFCGILKIYTFHYLSQLILSVFHSYELLKHDILMTLPYANALTIRRLHGLEARDNNTNGDEETMDDSDDSFESENRD